MEKTEFMIEYEIKIDSIVNWDFRPIGYTKYLESELIKARAKAAAYDRLMSMNSISENEIQIMLDGNAWCAYRLPFRNLQEDNAGFGVTPQIALTALLESELPDGWEERMNQEETFDYNLEQLGLK